MISRVLRGLHRRLNFADHAATALSGVATSDPDRPAEIPSEEIERVRILLAEAHPTEASALAQELAARFPASVQAQRLSGDALLAAGRPQLAMQAFRRALTLRPDDVSSLVGEAKSARLLGSAEDAVDSLEIALAHEPRALDALVELASLHQAGAEWPKVVSLLERALEVEPARADLWFRLASARDRCEAFDGAVIACERALAIDPKNLVALVKLGLLYLDRYGDPLRAETCFRKALAIDPSCEAASANLGLALQEQERFEEALSHYENAIRQAPANPEFRWNRGLVHLIQGHFKAGWQDYEKRFDRAGGRARRLFPLSPWHGEMDSNGALLVYAEQGLGDEIMFASCLPDLVDRGMAVVLECNPKLESLFRRSFASVAVRGEPRGNDRAWLSEFPSLSRQVAIGSLPRWLRSDKSQFPHHRGYLCADPLRIARWRERLASLGDGLTVGLLWRAGTLKTRRSQKSIPIELLLPLLDLPQVHYICLQHDLRDEERALLEAHAARMTFYPDACGDIEEVAAMCMALDLTFAVPSTNAHLAGALGRPVWILLSASPEWRWLRRGESSPWYPSARLWRQRSPGDWQNVIREVREEIVRLLESRRAPFSTGKS